MADRRTATDVLAERDVFRLRYSVLKIPADAASGEQQQVGFIRTTRADIKYMLQQDRRKAELRRSGA
jgi:hypothetical protein